MREISREEHEMILNLFIMAFMGWYMPTSEDQYIVLIDEWSLFYKVRDCFPMDEYHLPLMFSLLLGGNVNGNIVVNLDEV